MSDTSTNQFQGYGTAAERGAFTPDPATIAAAPKQLYEWYETDTGFLWVYDTSWHQVSSGVGAYVRLAQTVTTSSATTVDFTSISGSFTNLKVLIYAQDTNAGTADAAINLKINNDGTSGNYTACQRSGASNGAAFFNTTAASGDGSQAGIAAQSGTAGAASNTEVTITGYASTAFHKVVNWQAGENTTTGAGAVMIGSFRWKSTAAITRLTFKTGGTAFTDGSIFTLYGML